MGGDSVAPPIPASLLGHQSDHGSRPAGDAVGVGSQPIAPNARHPAATAMPPVVGSPASRKSHSCGSPWPVSLQGGLRGGAVRPGLDRDTLLEQRCPFRSGHCKAGGANGPTWAGAEAGDSHRFHTSDRPCIPGANPTCHRDTPWSLPCPGLGPCGPIAAFKDRQLVSTQGVTRNRIGVPQMVALCHVPLCHVPDCPVLPLI